jgi:hypothetical protein
MDYMPFFFSTRRLCTSHQELVSTRSFVHTSILFKSVVENGSTVSGEGGHTGEVDGKLLICPHPVAYTIAAIRRWNSRGPDWGQVSCEPDGIYKAPKRAGRRGRIQRLPVTARRLSLRPK